jgi:hypothetical protein
MGATTLSDIVRVPFYGSTLHTTLVDDVPHVVLRPTLEDMGLDYSAQLKKLKTRSWARVAETATHDASGRRQSMVTVDIDTWAMLLANIDENRVNKAVQPIVIRYQRESAAALRDYWTNGAAINPRATDEQIDRAKEDLTEIQKRRMAERMDYKNILNSLKRGGAISDEYRHVQNTLYTLLFGLTAEGIRRRQPQRTGELRKRGEGFRKSTVAKDFLTEEQLKLLNHTVLATFVQIEQHYPNGASAAQMVDAISRAVALMRTPRLGAA